MAVYYLHYYLRETKYRAKALEDIDVVCIFFRR